MASPKGHVVWAPGEGRERALGRSGPPLGGGVPTPGDHVIRAPGEGGEQALGGGPLAIAPPEAGWSEGWRLPSPRPSGARSPCWNLDRRMSRWSHPRYPAPSAPTYPPLSSTLALDPRPFPPPSALRPPPSALRPPPSALRPPPSALRPPPSALRPPPSLPLGPSPLRTPLRRQPMGGVWRNSRSKNLGGAGYAQ